MLNPLPGSMGPIPLYHCFFFHFNFYIYFIWLWIPIWTMLYVVSSVCVEFCVCASGPQATEWTDSSLSRLFDQSDSSPYFLFFFLPAILINSHLGALRVPAGGAFVWSKSHSSQNYSVAFPSLIEMLLAVCVCARLLRHSLMHCLLLSGSFSWQQ